LAVALGLFFRPSAEEPAQEPPVEATPEARAKVTSTGGSPQPTPAVPPGTSTELRPDGAVALAMDHGLVTGSCALSDPIDGQTGTFVGEQTWTVYTENGRAWFLEAHGAGTLYLPGQAPADLDLSLPDCGGVVAIEPASASIQGQVTVNGQSSQTGRVRACGVRVPIRDGFYQVSARPGEPCDVRAERVDGSLLTLSDNITVTPVEGENLLDLELPVRQGAIDLTIDMADDGVFVMTSGHAEIWEGDELVGVGGESVDGLLPMEIVKQFMGDEGTEVELVVEDGEGQQRTVVLTRAFIGDD
jgi:hypothetical protein